VSPGASSNVSGAPYVGTAVTKLNPSTYNVQTRTVQIEDTYGNLLQSQVYDYPLGTALSRTYN